MIPTGRPSARCSSRPKWNAAAENAAALAASQARHSPPTLVAGVAAGGFATVNSRRPEQPSAAWSAPPFDRCSGNSMLDWPDATHTSPAQTSANVSAFFAPRTFNVYGPPAVSAGSVTDQRPFASAFVAAFAAAMVAVTASPGDAAPATRNGRSRCTTMCSPTSGSTFTSARTAPERAATMPAATANAQRRREGFMPRILLFGLGDLDAVSPAGLGAVHGGVGQAQQRALATSLRAARRQVVAVRRHPERRRDVQQRRR